MTLEVFSNLNDCMILCFRIGVFFLAYLASKLSEAISASFLVIPEAFLGNVSVVPLVNLCFIMGSKRMH